MATCIICGDFAPTSKNEDIIAEGDIQTILGDELSKLFLNCDLVSVNLETAVTRSANEKLKRGQLNKTKPEVCSFFPKANISLCCLANNHIIDYGNEGVEDTIKYLERNQISHIGASNTLEKAKAPFVFDDLVIYNVSNDEFNGINGDNYGVNTLDLLRVFDDINTLKKEGKYIIVIYHGGVEYYRYPSPMLQKICRKMVDAGANLVTCQHSHCVGTYEVYNSNYIFYGQGNFLFDNSDSEMEKTGILLKVDTNTRKTEIIPISKSGSLVRAANAQLSDEIIRDIEYRRKEIEKIGTIESFFSEFAKAQENEIMNACLGYNKIYKAINKLTGGAAKKSIFTPKSKMRLYNILQSIALREVMIEVMSKYDRNT